MAEESSNTEGTQEQTSEKAEESTAGKQQERTFTQAELDRVVSDRLSRERKNQPNEDELKAYREWKKSQQSETEKIAEREKEFEAMQRQKADLEHELAVIRAGVKAEDADFVVFKVSKMEGDFSKNLGTYLAENKRFTEPETTIVEGAKHKPSAPDDGSALTDKERAIMGLPPNKKE